MRPGCPPPTRLMTTTAAPPSPTRPPTSGPSSAASRGSGCRRRSCGRWGRRRTPAARTPAGPSARGRSAPPRKPPAAPSRARTRTSPRANVNTPAGSSDTSNGTVTSCGGTGSRGSPSASGGGIRPRRSVNTTRPAAKRARSGSASAKTSVGSGSPSGPVVGSAGGVGRRRAEQGPGEVPQFRLKFGRGEGAAGEVQPVGGVVHRGLVDLRDQPVVDHPGRRRGRGGEFVRGGQPAGDAHGRSRCC